MATFASLGVEPAWGRTSVSGDGTLAAADRLSLAWDEASLPDIASPGPLMVVAVQAVFDSKGTAYPDTASGFRRITGKVLPLHVGASVVLSTKKVFGMWRRSKARNPWLLGPAAGAGRGL